MAAHSQIHDSSPLPTSTQHKHRTRASTGVAQKDVLYSAKYHPMDDVTRPTQALKHKTRCTNRDISEMQHNMDECGQFSDGAGSRRVAGFALSSDASTAVNIDEPTQSIEHSSTGYSLRKRPAIAPNYKQSWHPQDEDLARDWGRSRASKLDTPQTQMARGKKCNPMLDHSNGERFEHSQSTRRLKHVATRDDSELLGDGNVDTTQWQNAADEDATGLYHGNSIHPAEPRFKNRLVIPDSEGEDDWDTADEYTNMQGDDIPILHSNLRDGTASGYNEAEGTNADEAGDVDLIQTEEPSNTSERLVDTTNNPSQSADRPKTTPTRRNEQLIMRGSRDIMLNDDTRTDEHDNPEYSPTSGTFNEDVTEKSRHTEGSGDGNPCGACREYIRLRATALQALELQINAEDGTSRIPDGLFPTQIQQDLSTAKSDTEESSAYNGATATNTQAGAVNDTRPGDLAQIEEPTQYEVPSSRQLRYVEPFEVFEHPKGKSFFKHLKDSVFEGNVDNFETCSDERSELIEETVSPASHETSKTHDLEANNLSVMPEGDEEFESSMASSDSHNGDQTAREEIQENQCRELSESRRRLKRRWEAREASPDTSLGRYQRGKERKTRDREDRIRLFEDRGKNRKKSKGTSLDIVVYEESEQQQFVAWFVHLIDWAPIYNDYDQENVEVGLDGQATEPLQQDPTGHVSAKAEEDRSSADNERQIPNTAVHVVQQMGPNVQEQPPPTIPSLFGPFSTEANVVPLAAFDRNRLNGHGLR